MSIRTAVITAIGLVVFLQAGAEAAGFNAHDGVGAGIVAGVFVEDRQRQNVLFEILPAAGKPIPNDHEAITAPAK